MTDEELAREVCPDDPALGLRCVERMTAAYRQTVERLITLGDEINLWQAGLGPKPTGAIICGPKQVRRSGKF